MSAQQTAQIAHHTTAHLTGSISSSTFSSDLDNNDGAFEPADDGNPAASHHHHHHHAKRQHSNTATNEVTTSHKIRSSRRRKKTGLHSQASSMETDDVTRHTS